MATVVSDRSQLVAFHEDGCKPPGQWQIGTEHEKLVYRVSDLAPVPYEEEGGIAALLQGFTRFGWDPVYEQDRVIGLSQGTATIALEPGGQLELSGAPLDTIHETCAEVSEHLRQAKEVAGELGVSLIGLGYQPKWPRSAVPWMPKGRYTAMRRHMARAGRHGLDMMAQTCSVQVNLDYASEQDMVRKYRLSLALQPVAIALTANSPFYQGQPAGYLSYRSHVWQHTDPARCGIPRFVFEPGMGFERFVDYALDLPMFFVVRNGRYIDATGQSFRDFLRGRLPALPGEQPSLDDWALHLTTVYPEVRLKQLLELRGADGGPWGRLCALPAFWTGLLYDDVALSAASDRIGDWSHAEIVDLYQRVPVHALETEFRGQPLRELALELLTISRGGLRRRDRRQHEGHDESRYLEDLFAIAETGQTPAQTLLQAYYGRWGQDVDPVFREYCY